MNPLGVSPNATLTHGMRDRLQDGGHWRGGMASPTFCDISGRADGRGWRLTEEPGCRGCRGTRDTGVRGSWASWGSPRCGGSPDRADPHQALPQRQPPAEGRVSTPNARPGGRLRDRRSRGKGNRLCILFFSHKTPLFIFLKTGLSRLERASSCPRRCPGEGRWGPPPHAR